LFVKKKVIKENHTPLPPHPSVLAPHLGGCGTRPDKPQTTRLVAELKQSSPLTHLPLKPKARQTGFKVKIIRRITLRSSALSAESVKAENSGAINNVH
jgi:hypothetical protein